jgi:hypothetical protein
LCSQKSLPETPQPTTWPQLFKAVPQFWRSQVTAAEFGLQPQLPASLQVVPPSQVPQWMGRPQLSIVSPQRLLQNPGRGTQPPSKT